MKEDIFLPNSGPFCNRTVLFQAVRMPKKEAEGKISPCRRSDRTFRGLYPIRQAPYWIYWFFNTYMYTYIVRAWLRWRKTGLLVFEARSADRMVCMYVGNRIMLHVIVDLIYWRFCTFCGYFRLRFNQRIILKNLILIKKLSSFIVID